MPRLIRPIKQNANFALIVPQKYQVFYHISCNFVVEKHISVVFTSINTGKIWKCCYERTIKRVFFVFSWTATLLAEEVEFRRPLDDAYVTNEGYWKVKQSRYRSGLAQRVPGSDGSQTSWQRHRMVVRLSALRTGRLYPRKCSWYSFLLEAESTPGP
jgi:hypothetical protein